ncbi:MAG: aldose 1-epimerase [Bacteroidota bacterium]|nr:aldose 1-epimerase [Bacteroidota bacterium]
MSFHVSSNGKEANEAIVLEEKETGTRAEIFAFGALLNGFSIEENGAKTNVIYGFQDTADAQQNITPLFQSAKLSPFVCRMKEGTYTFAGQQHKLNKYFDRSEALHGLLFDAVFTVVEKGSNDTCAFVKLAHDYNHNDAGYPFVYRAEISYELKKNNRLTVSTKIINQSPVAMPVADGWHPYFSFGKKVNDALLCINTNNVVQFNDQLLPTGNFLPYQQFNSLQKINNTEFDNCFVVSKNEAQPACMLRDVDSGLQLMIFAEKNYPYLQIFIPQNRECIAIENLSSLPDSFNNGIGLTVLQPAQSKDFVASYQINRAKPNES